jgi:hypothetical protein
LTGEALLLPSLKYGATCLLGDVFPERPHATMHEFAAGLGSTPRGSFECPEIFTGRLRT